MTLLREVTGVLDRHKIPYALIGASALAAHGVSRSTLDIDLLTTDKRVLDRHVWESIPQVDVRVGSPDDPLAGVVRIQASAPPIVDIVVGRDVWQTRLVEAGRPVPLDDVLVPVVDAPGLILLKLFAGGSQDLWDIEQLLAAGDRNALSAAVDASATQLPAAAQQLWRQVREN